MRTPYDAAFGNLQPADRPLMGFYVAGYAPGQRVGSEWEFVLPQDAAARQARPDDQFGASWRGVTLPFSRLHFGVDPRVIPQPSNSGMPPNIVAQVQAAANQIQSPVIFDGMPLQDAIGFCKFILDTTINMSRYEIGVPTCGGPLHIGVITRASNFAWISKPLYSLNNTGD